MLRTILEEIRARISVLEKEMQSIKWIASETLKIAEANEEDINTLKAKRIVKIEEVSTPEELDIKRRQRKIRV